MVGLVFVGLPILFKVAVYLGNLRDSSGPLEIQDTLPPSTPQLTTLPSATTSATLNLSGFAEARSTVSLYQNGNRLDSGPANEAGEFSFPSITLDQDLNRFYVLATDEAGNESLPSSTQTVVFDSDAPTLNILFPASGQQFYGPGEEIMTVKGSTDPQVTIRINDRIVVVASDGSFSERLQLKEGDNQLLFLATDLAGNQTSTQLTVNYTK